MDIISVLEGLKTNIRVLIESAPVDGIVAYNTVIDMIDIQIENIQSDELAKLLSLNEKFDENHNNYQILLERGHIGIPTDYHKYLSAFSIETMTAKEVFSVMDDVHSEQILIDVVSDKNIIEQLVAYRHDYSYITHNKGHDGINLKNEVFEVKNNQYKSVKGAKFSPSLKFDRLSSNTLRKLDEGRPNIILNVTDKHKLLLEMKLKFTDELVETYKSKLAGVKGKDTSGTSISFTDYQHCITDISYICDNLEDYNMSLNLLEFINARKNTNYSTQRKINVNVPLQTILELNKDKINNLYSLGTPMAKIARECSTSDVKVSATHIKKFIS